MEVAYGLVLLGVMSVYLQIILGRICRRSTSWYVHNGKRAAYLLSNIVGSVAMGAMHPDRSMVVWILSLVVLNNSLVVYDQENGLQRALTFVNISLVIFQSVSAFNHNSQLARRSLLYWIELVSIIAFILACALCKFFINEAGLFKLYSEAVADYMKSYELRNLRGYNPSTLRGYRYLVKFKLPPRASDPPYPRTTVEDIYRRPENGDPEACNVPETPEQKRRKELCVSFALYRLLFCRYNHVNPCAQPKAAEKIRSLVFHWISERDFRPVEVELAFLHDHVHSGYVFWSSGLRRCYTGLSFLKAILYIASVVLYSKTTDTAMHVSVLVLVLVLLHLLLDILQIIFYFTSDRWMVSYMCRVPHAGLLHRVIFCIDRCVAQINTSYNANWFGGDYWQNRIGQYSLLEDPCNQNESNISLSSPHTFFNHTAKEADSVNLPPRLKSRIAETLRTLRNSTGALNGVPSLAPRLETKRHRSNYKLVIILKWHIATCYCEIAYRLGRQTQQHQHQQQDNPPYQECYEHATKLSRYCAYLVAFHPELLTDMVSDTKDDFRRVHDEYKRVIGWMPLLGSRFSWLESEANSEYAVSINQTTMIDGLKIGKLLRRNIEHVQRWRILEKIWLKLILIIALPSHQSETFYAEHVKCLAKGGELLTHLWSILSHAGILEQQRWPQDQVYVDPDEFTAELRESYGLQ